MSTTTPNAIRVALEKTISKIAPTNEMPAYSSRGFTIKGSKDPWGKIANDIDRRFAVKVFPSGPSKSYGLIAGHEAHANMILEMGHSKGADLAVGLARVQADARVIVLNLENPTKHPSGVYSIRTQDAEAKSEDKGDWLFTSVPFIVIYSEANV